MDNTDTCRTKKMDANKVWQWRIMHVKKYSRRPDPFYFSNRIGLDFNVASSAQKKLDLQLVTNGVILEICNFAKIVNKSKRRFLTNILENNFDLGFENEQQRIDFSARIHYKVKELIRKPPKDKNEVFTLFDTSSKAERNSNYGLTTASSEHLVEMDETDHSEHEDEFKFSQVTSKEYLQTEGFSEEMDEAPGDDTEHEYEFKYSKAQSAEELQEDCLPPLFPYCEGIGLNLDVGSKQSLDPDLLTNGVMLELVHFTRILTASYSPIVLDVLEHNFELDLKSQQEKSRLWFKISHLLRRRNRLLATGTKISLNFKDEQFSFQTNPLKRTKFSTLSNVEASQYHLKDVMKRRQSDLKSNQKKRALSRSSERVNKRHRIEQFEDMETNSLSHHTDLCTSEKAEGDHCHTFPLGESDQDSDKVTNPGYTSKLDHLQSPKSCSLNFDIAGDSEPSYLGFCTPLFTTTEISSSSSTVNSNVNPPFASQPEERGLCGGEEPSQTPRNGSNKHDMEQDEMGTEIMWKLRANRVKQILSSPKTEKDYCQFTMSKKAGLEFNVGFGPKKNISVDSLSDCVLLEVAKFALAMNSSQQDFIMEILEYNFDFSLQSQHQRNLFTCEIMKRVRTLRICEDAVRFSKEVFQLPGPMSSKMNMANQSVVGVTPELSSELRIKECAVVLVRLPHSHAETRQHISQKIVDLYPFCKKIGLKLHVNKSQPNKKLDINKLTNGAMTEVMNFAEKLCGTFEQICLDILRHNLDLDSQSGHSDLARDILARIPVIMEQKNVSNCASLDRKIKGTGTDYSTMVQLDCQNSANLDASSAGPSEAATIDQYVDTSADIQQQDEHNLMLWKLRARYIEYILSVPHEEHCPFYSYSRCKKIGIDFNVGSGIKQNLDPKLLTNGIMVELTKFATALLSSQRYFITNILEYNFHLDFKNELHRSAFATQTWYAIQTARKKFNFSRINMLFELPDLRYIQESTKCCPRCYQVRTDKLHQDESDAGHMHHPRPHTMTDTFLADANSTAQKPAKDLSLTLSAAVETIIDRYSRCKKIGLDLCVDKDQPKDKVDLHLLTHGIINEVFNFTMKLCGTKNKIINDVLEHNFKIGMQRQDINPAAMFLAVLKKYKKSGSRAWLTEVYVIQHYPQKQFRHASKGKQATYMRRSELKAVFEQRKLALQSKEKATAQEEMETENYYTCPLGESDLDLNITDSGGEEQTQTCVPNQCDMEQEEMGTETLWKLRANRVKQILSSPNKEFGKFTLSKRAGMKFCVGFGPKQHICVDSLTNSVLLEVAKFALAMNSSQQDFIMEILEYNFDFGLQSQHQRDLFTCEIMKRVRKLRSCEDAIKFSKEVFELPGPMLSINMANQSMVSVNSQLSIESRMEECDVAPVCPSDSHTESNEHISEMIMDPYPFCKEIGLKLHINNRKQNTKLDINKLTNGAMSEVTNFAEQLCGTFEQICLDILGHNFDFDLQSGDARSIVAAVCEQKNLSSKLSKHLKIKGTKATNLNQDCQNDQTLDASGTGSSQAAVMDDKTEYPEELDLKLWKLRANQMQQILSIPHGEHCPLYSYRRCKTLGIDFSVGSGVKQNLDPKLLTNGIMVEVDTFANALHSAEKYFITEILEYNFHLDFKSELHRTAFTLQIWTKVRGLRKHKSSNSRMNLPFELPDIQEPISDRPKYCPKCYQDRNDKLHQDESHPSEMHHPRPHIMLDTVSADANCIEQKPAKDPSLTSSATEEMIMDRYPRCKKIGLNLCVNKDQPKDKLDMHVLTSGIIVEVASFAKKLCGSKLKTICAIIENNFNMSLQPVDIWNKVWLSKEIQKDGGHAWLDEVCVFQPQRQPRHLSKLVEASATQISERKETIKKRMLALQTKEKRPTLPSPNTSVVKSKTHQRSKGKCFPHCTEIGLDLDVTSKSGQKEKLDLNLLTRAVVCEIHKFAVKNPGNYMPQTLFDILDYNFDLSSQHYRRWEFSIATTSKVQAMVKQRDMNRNRPHEVFKLPFIFAPKTHNEKPKKHSRKEPVKKKRMGGNHSDSSYDDFLNVVKTNEVAGSYEDTEFSIDPWSALPMCGSPVSEGCDSPLQGNIQIGEKEYDAHFGNMNPELDSETAVPMSRSLESEACGSPVQGNIQTKEEKYYPQHGNMKSEPDTDMIVQMSGSLLSVGSGSPLQGNIQKKEEEYEPHYGNMKSEPDTEMLVPLRGSPVSEGCDSPLPGNAQIKEEYNPHHGNMKPEPDTEEKHNDDVKTKSNTEDAQHLVPGVATGLLGYMPVVVLPDFVGPQAGLQNQYVQCYILVEPQGPAIRPDIVSNLTPRLNTEGVQYLVPVQAVGCPMVTIGPGNESTMIKQGQENVPADLQQGEVHRK